jgi:hypothetical protein
MVQSSKERLGNDPANCLDRTRNRRVLAQRQMGASLIVISPVRFEQVAKMPLAKYDDMIQAIPPDRADQPFRISVLPWRSRRRRPVTNAHRLKAAGENVAVDGVAVTDEVSWCCGPTVGLGELACDPLSRWLRGDPQQSDLAATVLQYQQSIEQSEGDGRNHEQVHPRACLLFSSAMPAAL